MPRTWSLEELLSKSKDAAKWTPREFVGTLAQQQETCRLGREAKAANKLRSELDGKENFEITEIQPNVAIDAGKFAKPVR